MTPQIVTDWIAFWAHQQPLSPGESLIGLLAGAVLLGGVLIYWLDRTEGQRFDAEEAALDREAQPGERPRRTAIVEHERRKLNAIAGGRR